MPVRNLYFILLAFLTSFLLPDLASADCKVSDRPAAATQVKFYATTDVNMYVQWAVGRDLYVDVVVDDLTANQFKIKGSVIGGLKGQWEYNLGGLQQNHNYRLTLSARTGAGTEGCLGAPVVMTAFTPSTADTNACRAYAAKAMQQQTEMHGKGCPVSGARWTGTQNQNYEWCINERLQHQTLDVSESKAREDAINACHGTGCSGGLCAPPESTDAQFAKKSQILQDWMAANHITNATIADADHSQGFGNRKADDPYPVASLSKAITATCIAKLVEGGQLNYTDTIGTRLTTFLKANPPVDARMNNITIAQLLRHISGFGKDPVVPPWASNITNTASADELFAKAVLATPLSATPGTTPYKYNNANYVLLGMIIKTVTNQSYESYCKQAVFAAHPYSDVRIGAGIPALGAFGGWEISARQYAHFIDANYRKLTPSRDTFMQASKSAGYGLGVTVNYTSKGLTINHLGNWPGGGKPAPATTPAQFSSFFSLWYTGDLVVVILDKSLTADEQGTLIRPSKTGSA